MTNFTSTTIFFFDRRREVYGERWVTEVIIESQNSERRLEKKVDRKRKNFRTLCNISSLKSVFFLNKTIFRNAATAFLG